MAWEFDEKHPSDVPSVPSNNLPCISPWFLAGDDPLKPFSGLVVLLRVCPADSWPNLQSCFFN